MNIFAYVHGIYIHVHDVRIISVSNLRNADILQYYIEKEGRRETVSTNIEHCFTLYVHTASHISGLISIDFHH